MLYRFIESIIWFNSCDKFSNFFKTVNGINALSMILNFMDTQRQIPVG